MPLDDIQKLMDETAEAKEYQVGYRETAAAAAVTAATAGTTAITLTTEAK
jgi:hypothetical protein